jgi:hypothetical protein
MPKFELLPELLIGLEKMSLLAGQNNWEALERAYPEWAQKLLAFVASAEMTQMPFERQVSLFQRFMRANQVLGEQTQETYRHLLNEMAKLKKEYQSAKTYLS